MRNSCTPTQEAEEELATNVIDLDPGAATSGDDVLFGSQGDDIISGQVGSDVISGLGGNDELLGELNDDKLIGGTGDDFLDGGTGDDELDGDDGADTLVGWTNDDVLRGGGEFDTLIGGPGRDLIDGGDEDDTIWTYESDLPAFGTEVMDGGGAWDTYFYNGAETAETLILSPNTTDVLGTPPDTIPLATHAILKRVFGDENAPDFNLEIRNTESLDFSGLGGVDSLTVGDMTGTGVQQVNFFSGAGSDQLNATASSTAIFASGGDGADFFFGSRVGDIFEGEAGADHIFANAGDDVVNAGDGNDIIGGGSGNDVLDGGLGNDDIIPGPGDDLIIVQDGADRIRYDQPNGGNDVFDGFSFADTAFFGGLTPAQLDTNGDTLVSDVDDLASIVDGNLTVTLTPTDSLTFLGVNLLSLPNDVVFV